MGYGKAFLLTKTKKWRFPLTKMFNVFNISKEFLVASIKATLELHRTGKPFDPDSDCRQAYFAGRTLFLDIKDKNGEMDAITICHADEDYGYFSGGTRRLLPIEALRDMESLMREMNIQHEPKEMFK